VSVFSFSVVMLLSHQQEGQPTFKNQVQKREKRTNIWKQLFVFA